MRARCLEAFYRYGRSNGRVDPELVLQLIVRMQELWGDSNGDGREDSTGRNIQARFRSSSNLEDGVEFNGAGLYESTTVCLPDHLDRDTIATCDPSEDHEETIERALRKVWMSLYLPRAFEERIYYQFPQEPDRIAMAVLVNTGIPDELANGVAFTGIPSTAQSGDQNGLKRYAINIQVGELSVVDPPPGTQPEVTLITVGPPNNWFAYEVRVVRPSSEVMAGRTVFEEFGINQGFAEMAYPMMMIERELPVDRGPYAPEQIIWDLEFKWVEEPREIGGRVFQVKQLKFKQARPFLIGPAASFTGLPVLPDSPQGLDAEVTANQVILRWQAAAADDTLAIIERSSSGTVWQAIETVRSSVTTYTDTDDTASLGATPHYRVRLENNFGQSEPSNVVIVGAPASTFRRGDANADGTVDLSDPIFTVNVLQAGNPQSPCQDAADANDDGQLSLQDALFSLAWQFGSSAVPPPSPGPDTPGPDPTADGLGCVQYP